MCARNNRGRRSPTSSSKTGSDRVRSSSRRRSSSRARSVQRSRSYTTDNDEDCEDDPSRRRSRSASTGRRGRGSSMSRSNKKAFNTPFDKKGRCHHHPNVKLAKKKLTGWKVIMDNCPMCLEEKNVKSSNWFNRSFRSRSKSRNSKRSSRSFDSDRSVASRRSSCSNRSVSPGRKKISPLLSSGKQKEPFDSKGYCHRHSNVRLAKRKLTGGWKLLLDCCPECAAEEKESRSVSSKSSRRSRSRSVCSRSTRSRSVCSRKSRHDGRRQSHRCYDESVSDASSHSQRVRNVKKIADIGIISCKTRDRRQMMMVNDDKSSEGTKPHCNYTGSIDMMHKKRSILEGEGQSAQLHLAQVQIGEFDDSAIFEMCWENERRKAVNCIKVSQYNCCS